MQTARPPATPAHTYARVTLAAEGFHRWPDAPQRRLYLRQEHRHLFHVTVVLQVHHTDREVEFHDLLFEAQTAWPGGWGNKFLGTRSCEQIASIVGTHIAQRYPGRSLWVQVMEDDENGALVEFTVPLGPATIAVPAGLTSPTSGPTPTIGAGAASGAPQEDA